MSSLRIQIIYLKRYNVICTLKCAPLWPNTVQRDSISTKVAFLSRVRVYTQRWIEINCQSVGLIFSDAFRRIGRTQELTKKASLPFLFITTQSPNIWSSPALTPTKVDTPHANFEMLSHPYKLDLGDSGEKGIMRCAGT